ncbi:MAG TPA: SCP2 sterol-binding domain-containing protein [Polyangiaceae bacterium]|nr:SCP2 sterol-binding domain-containing protein [Polyangiaceae bacterium]
MAAVASVKEYFDTLHTRFVASASKGLTAVFQFELSGEGGGSYNIAVNDGTMEVKEGASATPSVTIKMSADDYLKLVNGQLNGTMAYMKGQMKVTGNLMLAQKMQAVFPVSK